MIISRSSLSDKYQQQWTEDDQQTTTGHYEMLHNARAHTHTRGDVM